MTNEEIAALVEVIPNLERLALKPGGSRCFDHRCLRDVTKQTELQVFGFHHWKEEMFIWEDGIEHLAKLPRLKCGNTQLFGTAQRSGSCEVRSQS